MTLWVLFVVMITYVVTSQLGSAMRGSQLSY